MHSGVTMKQLCFNKSNTVSVLAEKQLYSLSNVTLAVFQLGYRDVILYSTVLGMQFSFIV